MISTILALIDSSLLLISFILILLNWKRLNITIKIFGFYIALSFCVQTSAFILPYLIRQYNNFWLLHLLTFGEFIFLSLFYYHLFQKNRKFQKFIRVTLPIISVMIICNSIFLEPITWYNSNAKTLTQVFLIGYAIYYFYVISTKEILIDIHSKALHTINSAILLYYAGSLFIFMSGKLAVSFLWKDWKPFLIFNAVLHITCLIIVLVGLWKITYKQRI